MSWTAVYLISSVILFCVFFAAFDYVDEFIRDAWSSKPERRLSDRLDD